MTQVNSCSNEINGAFFDKVEQVSRYKSSSKVIANPRLRHSLVFYGWCSQRTDVNRQSLDEDTRRFCNRTETYDCEGELKGVLHRDQRWVI